MLNKILSRFNLFTKIAILGALIIVLFVIGIFLVFSEAESAMLMFKKAQVQLQVETAFSIANHYFKEYSSGNLSLEEAQQQSLYTIKQMRYEGENYFWINDTHPNMVMHALKPELDGEDLTKNEDPTGKRLFVEMSEVALSEGEGFVNYLWDNPADDMGDVPVQKISYVKYLEDWDWIVGSGMYVGDYEAQISTIQQIILIIVIVVVVISVGFILVIARSIANPVKKLAEVSDALALGDLDHELDSSGRDEVADLTRAFEKMVFNQKEIAEVAGQIADGNLAVENKPRSEKDVLGIALEKMIFNLQNLIRDVRNNSSSLTDASRQLATASDQAGQAANQIGTTIQQVAVGNQQQTESVTTTANQVDQLGRAISGVAQGAQEQAGAISSASDLTAQISASAMEVSQNAKSGAETAQTTADTAQSGSDTVERNLTAMANIKQKVDLSSEKVKLMGERSEEIGAILETINDIASQTNMLALNAAIEAARAGEHGKGFAVVADEVRRLAEHSAEATDEIAKLIEEVQATVEEAVDAMGQSAAEVDTGVNTANEAGMALQEILEAANAVIQQSNQIFTASSEMEQFSNQLVDAMDTVSAVVEENTAATEEMSASSTEVTRAIEDISSISEENAAAVEEVSAGTEEMNAQVEEVAASANDLSDMAEELDKLVSQFKLEDEAAEEAGDEEEPTLEED